MSIHSTIFLTIGRTALFKQKSENEGRQVFKTLFLRSWISPGTFFDAFMCN